MGLVSSKALPKSCIPLQNTENHKPELLTRLQVGRKERKFVVRYETEMPAGPRRAFPETKKRQQTRRALLSVKIKQLFSSKQKQKKCATHVCKKKNRCAPLKRGGAPIMYVLRSRWMRMGRGGGELRCAYGCGRRRRCRDAPGVHSPAAASPPPLCFCSLTERE